MMTLELTEEEIDILKDALERQADSLEHLSESTGPRSLRWDAKVLRAILSKLGVGDE